MKLLHCFPALAAKLIRKTLAAGSVIAVLALSSWQTRATVPEPDNLVFGAIVLDNRLVTAADTNVVVEARTQTGQLKASYRMGQKDAAGNFFTLRLRVESTGAASNVSASALGTTLIILVRDESGVRGQKTVSLNARGQLSRMDFGSLDVDGNSLADTWETQYFGRTGVDPNGDPDHDGHSNFQEFTAGTNPLVANNVTLPTIALSGPPANGGQLVVSGTAGATYVVEASSDVINWTALGEISADVSGSARFHDSNATSITTRFYRVRFK
jgi:hypothetical protein